MTEEREAHITRYHPELLPEHQDLIPEVLAAPDEIRQSLRSGTARLFSRWYNELRGGKHVVVVVVSDPELNQRHWVITPYIARKLAAGETEWTIH